MMLFPILLATAAQLAPATIVPPPSKSEPIIIVEGQRPPTEREALHAITRMTKINESQIARFHDPVCPLVVGMARPAAAMVEDRIRATVRMVGGRVQEPLCEGNLLVFIARDGGKFFNEIRRERPMWLDGLSSPEKARLAANGPVRAWSVTSVRNEDGLRASLKAAGPAAQRIRASTNRVTSTNSLLDRVPQMRVYANSFLRNQSRYELDGSVVIIDADAAEGLTLRQLGEYAALRGLIQIREPDDVGQMNSILSIFDRPKGTGPRQLTPFDRHYLAGLYDHLRSRGLDSSVHERQRLAEVIGQ